MGLPKIKINWEGSYFVNHSLALVNREICKQLITEHPYDIGIIPYEEDPTFIVDNSIRAHYVSPNSPANITIRHQWPPNFNKPKSDKWILFQPWEYGAIPRKWYIPMKHWIDEIWVYSTYNKDCYVRSGIPEHKIKVIPLGVDENIFHFNVKTFELKTKKSFHFLFVGGTIFRKGIDTLLQAYLDEFSAKDDVCLVIKDFGANSFYQGQTAEQTIEEIKKNPNNPAILYLNEELSAKDLAGLYKSCDCLVHPYRGEGFGLPIIESMACGTPAIVPSLGPAADFCNEDTAFFISSQEETYPVNNLGEIETITNPWWIKINKNELQKKMRFVYENRKIVKEKGQKASQEVLSAFTWRHTSNQVSNLVQQILTKDRSSITDRQKIIQSEIMESAKLVVSQALSLEQSFEILQSLLDVYPHSISARYYTALFYLKANDFQSALNHLLVITDIVQKQPEGLKSEIMNVIEENPERFQSEVWNHIGVCYTNLKEWKKATEAFQKGIGSNPRNMGKVIELYQKMIRDFSESTDSLDLIDLYHELGTLYFQIGNDFCAKEIYEKALELDAHRLDVQEKLDAVKKRMMFVKETYVNPSPDRAVKDVKELYQRITQYFEGDETSRRQLYQKWTAYFLPGERVLDIGCGNGLFMEMLHQLGVETDGLDFDPEKVARGKAKGLNILEKKAEDFLSDKEGVYDGIFMGHIIEHIPPQDLLNLLIQCTKALKPNGKMIILTPNIAHPPVLEDFWLDITHVRPYPTKLVASILHSLGLTVKEFGYRNHNYDLFVIAQKNAYEVLWQSSVFQSIGYANEQKSYMDALKPFPLKIRLEATDIQQKETGTDIELNDYLTNLQNNDLTFPLIHYQAAPAYQFSLPCAPISIGRTMFETDSLPPGWVEKMKQLTEIWVPSEFNKETFIAAGVEKDKIFIVPPVIDCQNYNPERAKPYRVVDAKSFQFLSVFDWNKRKGWDVLVRAYMQEFHDKEDVCLILKVSNHLEVNADPREDILREVRKLGLTAIPHIEVINDPFTEEEMVQLYASVDAFVLPSRGEGYGRPYMEAMAMALPTIGTRWSGQTSFMDDTNSYLVDINGVLPIEHSIPYFGQFQGHKWAEPNEDHLRTLMRNVYEN